MAMKLPSIPGGRTIAERDGAVTVGWWLFFDGLLRLFSLLWAAYRLVIDEELTAASTTIDAPDTGTGGELVVILRQDATGGRAIVWGTGFVAASTAIDTTASTISTFRFTFSDGDWVMTAHPTTGMVP